MNRVPFSVKARDYRSLHRFQNGLKEQPTYPLGKERIFPECKVVGV
jgi:hypothetical protein